MSLGMDDEPIDVPFGTRDVAGPKKNRNTPNQRPGERHRMDDGGSMLYGPLRQVSRLIRMPLQPQSPRQCNFGVIVVVEIEMGRSALPRPRFRPQALLQFPARGGDVAEMMECAAQQGMIQGYGGGIG